MTTGELVARPRESWVDVAKGMAILLVVLFHAVIFLDDVGLAGPWNPVIGILGTFRMPLFFLTAGLFARKAIALSFADLFRQRIANLLWLYALWSTVWTITFLVIPVMRPESNLTPLEKFLLLPVWPNASTWFVYALALFFALAWAMRRLPVWLQLAPAAGLSLLFGTNLINTGNDALDKMATYFLFFLLAANLGPGVLRIAASVKVWHAIALLPAYAAVAVITARAELLDIVGVEFAASILATATGVSLAVVLSRYGAFDWLREIGTRTLPVYLVHFYPILIAVALLAPVAGSLRGLSVVLPPALAVLAVLSALGFHRVTRRAPGLYRLPMTLRRIIAARASAPSHGIPN